jgi:FixJ family two-component response regulator
MPLQMTEKAIVHIVDDDVSVRDSLELLFGSVGLISRTYAAARGFLNATIADAPGCLVVDMRLPDMNGFELQEKLTLMGVFLPVVMITGYGDVPTSVRAMKRGAVDFLVKPLHDQYVLDAIMAAIECDRHRRAAAADVARVQQLFKTLSARERQVMMLVASGKMNKQVAGDLGISEVTVKIHRSAAMRKMGARTLPDLVRMAQTVSSGGQQLPPSVKANLSKYPRAPICSLNPHLESPI